MNGDVAPEEQYDYLEWRPHRWRPPKRAGKPLRPGAAAVTASATKVHVGVDGLGHPLRFIRTGGQAPDITQADGSAPPLLPFSAREGAGGSCNTGHSGSSTPGEGDRRLVDETLHPQAQLNLGPRW